MLTLTHRVVAMRAAAIGAVTHCAGVRTVRAATGGAFVVVHPLVGAMLAVHMAVMQIVHVITVQHRFVPTPRTVGVAVPLSLGVLDRGHGPPSPHLSDEVFHAYMRSYECQEAVGDRFVAGHSPGRVTRAAQRGCRGAASAVVHAHR